MTTRDRSIVSMTKRGLSERGGIVSEAMGFCCDCGEEYELDALDLDLRCASCVEQWIIDKEAVNA